MMFEDHLNNEIILHENKLGSIIQCKSYEKIAITINNTTKKNKILMSKSSAV